jgi:membrane-bound serine protease (ClpP class)
LDGKTVVVNGEDVVLETAVAPQSNYSMNLIERLLHAVANPVLVGILMAIGVQAIIIEISNPGGWVAGLIGVIFLGLGLYGLGQLPVNWFGMGLIIIAFVLFLAEVLTVNNGALALAGTLCLFGGLLLLFNSPGTPEFARISYPAALGITLGTASVFLFIMGKALQAQRAKPYGGVEDFSRESGLAKSTFSEASTDGVYNGSVMVLGELWQATSDEPITLGDSVEVIGKDGFTLKVSKK